MDELGTGVDSSVGVVFDSINDLWSSCCLADLSLIVCPLGNDTEVSVSWSHDCLPWSHDFVLWSHDCLL